MIPVSKTMISIRLDDNLKEMLDRIAQIKDSMFYDRDRTWLIEHAIKETYESVDKINEVEVDAPSV